MGDYNNDPRFQELRRLVAELLGRNMGEYEVEDTEGPMDEVVAGVKVLVEADVLRRLPRAPLPRDSHLGCFNSVV